MNASVAASDFAIGACSHGKPRAVGGVVRKYAVADGAGEITVGGDSQRAAAVVEAVTPL